MPRTHPCGLQCCQGGGDRLSALRGGLRGQVASGPAPFVSCPVTAEMAAGAAGGTSAATGGFPARPYEVPDPGLEALPRAHGPGAEPPPQAASFGVLTPPSLRPAGEDTGDCRADAAGSSTPSSLPLGITLGLLGRAPAFHGERPLRRGCSLSTLKAARVGPSAQRGGPGGPGPAFAHAPFSVNVSEARAGFPGHAQRVAGASLPSDGAVPRDGRRHPGQQGAPAPRPVTHTHSSWFEAWLSGRISFRFIFCTDVAARL